MVQSFDFKAKNPLAPKLPRQTKVSSTTLENTQEKQMFNPGNYMLVIFYGLLFKVIGIPM